ncbi:MAG: glycoside hydrolase family 2 protein, partial [Solirubrobacterales bacterium]|nr:glycoside hydrolase family 2 protein [Solirubrobacterales bacterium]
VGPWKGVSLLRRQRVAIESLVLRARLDGEDGVLSVGVRLRGIAAAVEAVALEVSGPSGAERAELSVEPAAGGVSASGELCLPRVDRWWPHTHGEPALYGVELKIATGGAAVTADAGRVGFRELEAGPGPGHDVEEDGLDLHLNGVRVFARGALWTPPDAVGLAPDAATLRGALEQVRAAGMNMVRIPGTGAYESACFHDLCDELGILVWQDFMFANLDYPVADEGFRAGVEREARAVLAELGQHPSLAVLCGNSEVEQQVAMLGLEPELGRGELFGELLPDLVAASAVDAPYLPSAPCGGSMPFRPDRGVANYFGVGGYRRPLEDARRAAVRFASECLAISNVPDEAGVEAVMPGAAADVVVHHPRWKAGVPRDAGAGWDFEDVRDHYLRLLFGVDPVELRSCDNERYLELSRAVSGEVMAAVFSEWRRSGSPCGGGLILWLRDLAPGAGWGIVDSAGSPKVAYHHLRRVLAPIAVSITDEGLGGLAVHIANDGREPLRARLRIGLYRDGEQRVGEGEREVGLQPHDALSLDAEAVLGRFADLSYAYRFGPPAQDLVVATIEAEGSAELLSQAFHFPAGRPTATEAAERLGLEASAAHDAGGAIHLRLRARRFVYGLRIHAPGLSAADDALSIEPGGTREVALRRSGRGEPGDAIRLSALNMRGRVTVPVPAPPSP